MISNSIRFLHPRFASFHKTRSYEATATVEEAQQDLALLEAHRRRLARRYRLYGWTALVVLLGTLGATFALADSRTDDEVTLATLVAGGVVFVALLVVRRRHRAIENRRLLLARLLLRELDIRPGSSVALQIDLADIFCRRKAAGQVDGRKTYRDPWFSLGAELADGSSICLRRAEELSYHTLHDLNKIIYRWHTTNTDDVTIELPPGVGVDRVTHTVPVPDGMAPVSQSFADGKMQIRLASGDKWGSHATAAQEGLLDLPSALAQVLDGSYSAVGLAAPFRADDDALPSARLPLFGSGAVANALTAVGVVGLIIALPLTLDLLGKSGSRFDDELAVVLGIGLGAGLLPLALGMMWRRSLRRRARGQDGADGVAVMVAGQ